MSRTPPVVATLIAFVVVAIGGCAGAPRTAGVALHDGWVRYLPAAENTAAYFTLVNRSDRPVRVDSVSTPIARAAEWHTSAVEGDRMVMRPIPAMEIPAHGERKLEPGGAHLMLIGVRQPLSKGATVPVRLTFSDGSRLAVQLPVREPR